MPIRVTCPGGHPLNVKDEYAGRLAKCPHCGEKFRIPVPDPPDEPELLGDDAFEDDEDEQQSNAVAKGGYDDSEWDDLAQFDGASEWDDWSDEEHDDEFDEEDHDFPAARMPPRRSSPKSGRRKSVRKPEKPAEVDDQPAASPVSSRRPLVLAGAFVGGLALVSVVAGVVAVTMFSSPHQEDAPPVAEQEPTDPDDPTLVAGEPPPATSQRGDAKSDEPPNQPNPKPAEPAPADNRPSQPDAVAGFHTEPLGPPAPQPWPGNVLGPFDENVPPGRQTIGYSISADGRHVAVTSRTHAALFGPDQFSGQAQPVLLKRTEPSNRSGRSDIRGLVPVGWVRPAEHNASWTVVLRAGEWDDERIRAAAGNDTTNLNRVLVRLAPSTLQPADDGLPSRVVLPSEVFALAENGTIDRYLATSSSKFSDVSLRNFSPAIAVHWPSGTSRYLPQLVSQGQRGDREYGAPKPPAMGTLRREVFPLGGTDEIVDGVVDDALAFRNIAAPEARFVGVAPAPNVTSSARTSGHHPAPGRFVAAVPGRPLVVSLDAIQVDGRKPWPADVVFSDDLTGTPVRVFRLPESFNGFVAPYDPARSAQSAEVVVAVSADRIAVVKGDEVAVLDLATVDLPAGRPPLAGDVRMSSRRQPGDPIVVRADPGNDATVEFVSGPDGADMHQADGFAEARWTPGPEDVGDVDFVVRHTSGKDVVDQTVRLTVGPKGFNIDALGLHGYRVVGMTPDGTRLLAATTGDAVTIPDGKHHAALIDVVGANIISRVDLPDVNRVGWLLTDQAAIAVEDDATVKLDDVFDRHQTAVHYRSLTTFRLNDLTRVASRSLVPEDADKVSSAIKLQFVSPGSIGRDDDADEPEPPPFAGLLVIDGTQKGREILQIPSLEPLPIAEWLANAESDGYRLPVPIPHPGGYEIGPFVLDAAGRLDYLTAPPLSRMFTFGARKRFRSTGQPDKFIRVPGTEFGLNVSLRSKQDRAGRADDLLVQVARAGRAKEVSPLHYGEPFAVPASSLSYAVPGTQTAPPISSSADEALASLLLLGRNRAVLTDGVHVHDIDVVSLAPTVIPLQDRPGPQQAGRPVANAPRVFDLTGTVELNYQPPGTASVPDNAKPPVVAMIEQRSNLRFSNSDLILFPKQPDRDEVPPGVAILDLTPLRKLGPFRMESPGLVFPGPAPDGQSMQSRVRSQLDEYLETVRPLLNELLGRKIKGVPLAVTFNVYVSSSGKPLPSAHYVGGTIQPLDHTVIIDIPERIIIDAFRDQNRSR